MFKDYLKSNDTTLQAHREFSTLLHIILTIHKGGRVVVTLPVNNWDRVGERKEGT